MAIDAAVRPEGTIAPAMNDIGRHIPHLRRFARALTGSQILGDGYVGETLQALLADRPALLSRNSKLGLYRTFFALWKRFDGLDPVDLTHAVTGKFVDQRLQRMVPLDRAVFLLSALEGFDEEEVSAITGLSLHKVELVLDDADRDFFRTERTDVLIIEDEWLVAADLKRIVEGMGHRVVGHASRQDAAILAAHMLRPGLILADVQLDREDGGIVAVESVSESLASPVVYVTGHPARLLTGRGLEPIYLVAKPFSERTLTAVIEQALFFGEDGRRRTPFS